MMRTTSTHLADGRELIYFDDSEPYASGAATRELHDPRSLPATRPDPMLRRDPLTGEWVTIAAHRGERTQLPAADECPLCPTRPGRGRTEVPAADYDVVAFENRFPSFAPGGEPSLVDGDPMWPRAPARGRCEVICFSSDHDAGWAELGPRRARTVVGAWAERTAALSALEGVAQVFCFENRGEQIGVTLTHPHGQIYAYPFVTPRTEALLCQAAAHRDRTGRDLQADVLAAECRAGTRVVRRGESWTAFVPAAARWPVEIHLVPHRSVPDLAGIDDAERAELAVLYPELIRRVDGFFADRGDTGPVPSVAAWHQAPVSDRRELARLYLQVFSLRRGPARLKYLAGSESAAGAWLVDTCPEAVAARLRELGR